MMRAQQRRQMSLKARPASAVGSWPSYCPSLSLSFWISEVSAPLWIVSRRTESGSGWHLGGAQERQVFFLPVLQAVLYHFAPSSY